ncbi:LapA family protein [Carboxydothermus hydrogenoformans]|uniref:Lipopolysaccharide assembly protein A domain-containing protein n=1 Tax=Carboxydothermus hydrogenoformans (strain ATCC BAA-161 / DSM 6008 / Z-2901) TaxID=246194 RepID=Q3ABG0_CARHZ|nr:LapA family protein [Carboxydothermus hydrogenoformans]ABB14208.1 conserved hypothetical protein [Carboxydothermus hydrogenoformans Z-2901]
MSKGQAYFILALIFAILITVFAFQNQTAVAINFLAWSLPEIPLVLVIFLSALAGVVTAILLGFGVYFKMVREVKALKKEVEALKISNSKQENL